MKLYLKIPKVLIVMQILTPNEGLENLKYYDILNKLLIFYMSPKVN